MTISAKLKHETHLDHEMREYYQARIKGFIKPSIEKEYIAKLDSSQVRQDDGREEFPND